MDIKCDKCGHTEETSMKFFVRVLGGALPVGGYWAWVTYFFAGTGLAMPIVIAMIAGGSALLMFQDEVIEWLSNRGYSCSECGASSWSATK